MYNCQVCGTGCGPGVPLRKHTIYRDKPAPLHGKDVHQEVPVCAECERLASFTPIAILIRQRGSVKKAVTPPAPVVPQVSKADAPLKPGEAVKRLDRNPRLVYRK